MLKLENADQVSKHRKYLNIPVLGIPVLAEARDEKLSPKASPAVDIRQSVNACSGEWSFLFCYILC